MRGGVVRWSCSILVIWCTVVSGLHHHCKFGGWPIEQYNLVGRQSTLVLRLPSSFPLALSGRVAGPGQLRKEGADMWPEPVRRK